MFKKLEKEFCPFIGKKCVKDSCMMWLTYQSTDEKGTIQTHGNCTFVVQAIQNIDVIGTNKGIQASIESFRNETIQSQKNVLGIANVMRHQRKINGE